MASLAGGRSQTGSIAGSVDSRSTTNLESDLGVGEGLTDSVLEGETMPLDPQCKTSLHRNLEVQEMTLRVQMDLQEQLSRQLELQKRLQSEMESLMAAHREAREMGSTSCKMSSILALKRKLQHELQVSAGVCRHGQPIASRCLPPQPPAHQTSGAPSCACRHTCGCSTSSSRSSTR